VSNLILKQQIGSAEANLVCRRVVLIARAALSMVAALINAIASFAIITARSGERPCFVLTGDGELAPRNSWWWNSLIVF
jgi:hypothetical protein